MISKGTTHNDGAKLARYMTSGKDGERAELWELRGFGADNIVDAFRDVHIMAEGTKCEQPFFHVQVRNPAGETLSREQWRVVANRHERKLGLTGQPRAIAFHIDELTGHEHMHIAWSRIDDETMTAKPLPFFKERLKKTSRELELHFNLTRVRNERDGSIDYAPTRAEDEQARRIGVNIHEVRQTIRDCYERSDCGSSFQAALEHEGLTLARGDKRDFIVIDHAGGMHALGKRILGVSAAQTRNRLADLTRDELPTVEQARMYLPEYQRNQQQQKPEPVWDRDRDERAWQDAIINAAIEKEKAERQFAEPKPEKETRPGGREKEQERKKQQQPAAAPELGKTQGEIRLARGLSHGPQGFANALEDRGFILARVTADDIRNEMEQLLKQWEERRRNPQTWMEHEGGFALLPPELQDSASRSFDEWEKARDKKKDKDKDENEQQKRKEYTVEDYVDYVQKKWLEGPKSQLERATGELAVITPHGSIYTLTPRNTGLDRDELPHYLKGIDRAPLLTVTDAQAVFEDLREHRREDWLARLPLGKAAGEIRLAYSLTQTGQEFADALEDRGFLLACMTEADAERLNGWERQRLKEEWQAPAPGKTAKAQSKEPGAEDYEEYHAGELAAVNQYGQIFQFTAANTGQDINARAERFKDIDLDALLSVTAAQSMMQNFQQHRHQERENTWQQKRDEWLRPAREEHWPTMPPQPERKSPGLFEQAATEANHDSRTDLHGTAAQVWTAFRQSGNEEAFKAVPEDNELYSVRTGDRKAFAAALDDKGIAFAAVTKEEADRSHKEAAFARAVGNYAPRFKEGEIVIVTEPRPEYRRDGELTEPRRVQKLDQSLAGKFVTLLDNRSQLQGIDATLKASDNRFQERRDDKATERLERATNIWRPARTSGIEKSSGLQPARAIGGLLNAATKPLDILFSLLDPPKTPGQLRQEAIKAEAEREAQAEHQIDFSKWTADQAQERRNDQDQQAARDRRRDIDRDR